MDETRDSDLELDELVHKLCDSCLDGRGLRAIG